MSAARRAVAPVEVGDAAQLGVACVDRCDVDERHGGLLSSDGGAA